MRLNPDIGSSDVNQFVLTPDGSQVFFSIGADEPATKLFRVSVRGGVPVRMSRRAGGDFVEFWISPDGATVAYSFRTEAVSRRDLFSVPMEGGPTVQLSPAGAGSARPRVNRKNNLRFPRLYGVLG